MRSSVISRDTGSNGNLLMMFDWPSDKRNKQDNDLVTITNTRSIPRRKVRCTEIISHYVILPFKRTSPHVRGGNARETTRAILTRNIKFEARRADKARIRVSEREMSRVGGGKSEAHKRRGAARGAQLRHFNDEYN